MEWKTGFQEDSPEATGEGEELFTEEDFSAWKQRQGALTLLNRSPLLAVGLGVAALAVLVAVLVVLLPGRRVASDGQTGDLVQRLDQLENRLNAFAAIDQRLMELENLNDRIPQLVARLDRLEATVNKRLADLTAGLRQVRDSAPAPAPAASSAPASTGDTPVFHTVAAGETLYRIAKAHGLTVEDLRRFNGLDRSAVIQPGQRLRLTP